jgi:hypothetical protein
MEYLPKPLMTQLAKVIESRVLGLKWEAVAAKVGRRAETIRRWPTRFPQAWRRLYRAAECRILAEAGAEARSVLRHLLFSEDERVRCNAGKFLAALQEKVYQWEDKREAAASPIDDEWAPFITYLQGLTEEEARDFVLESVECLQAEKAGQPLATPPEPESPPA